MNPTTRRSTLFCVPSELLLLSFALILPNPSRGWTQLQLPSRTTGVVFAGLQDHDGGPQDSAMLRVASSSSSSSSSSSKNNQNKSRRSFLAGAVAGGVLLPLPGLAQAGTEQDGGGVASRITEAVTTSDLGVSVRRSVVKGAQLLDRLDGQWESFSDRFHLGQARSQREGRPLPKVIPDPMPLESAVARRLLDSGDKAFCDAIQRQAGVRLSMTELQGRVRKVAATVAPAFRRSGQSQTTEFSLCSGDPESRTSNLPCDETVATGAALNFLAYAHFRAYNDAAIELLAAAAPTNYAELKHQFELQLGCHVLDLLVPGWSTSATAASSSHCWIQPKLRLMEELCRVLVQKGLVATIDVSPIDPDDLDDFCQGDGTASLAWSVALDGDVTLGSQVLLQEQGLRLYPNYARFAFQVLLGSSSPEATSAATPQLSIMDYYMDTDYNSDPDKFEVKEVLLNIELES